MNSMHLHDYDSDPNDGAIVIPNFWKDYDPLDEEIDNIDFPYDGARFAFEEELRLALRKEKGRRINCLTSVLIDVHKIKRIGRKPGKIVWDYYSTETPDQLFRQETLIDGRDRNVFVLHNFTQLLGEPCYEIPDVNENDIKDLLLGREIRIVALQEKIEICPCWFMKVY